MTQLDYCGRLFLDPLYLHLPFAQADHIQFLLIMVVDHLGFGSFVPLYIISLVPNTLD